MKRVPFANISKALKSCSIKIVKHGRHLKKNAHWQNFFLPDKGKEAWLYEICKKMRNK